MGFVKEIMIPDPLMQAEAKFRNKLKVRTCSNLFVMISNNHGVCIDEGLNDRRYFISDADFSSANDQ